MLIRSRGSKSDVCFAEITYGCFENEGQNFSVYGLKIAQNNKKVLVFSDLTDDFEKIECLRKAIDKHCISEKHLFDIIEDFVDSLHFYSPKGVS